MANYYIDTCSLKWRYLNGTPTTHVNSLMESKNDDVYSSELTILEWSNALAAAFREDNIDFQTFKSNELALMTDIVNDRLKIFRMARAIERARYLIEYIGVGKKKALRTNDAIHVVTALELASAIRAPVEFVTSDRRLARIIEEEDTFRPHLTSSYLAP